MMRRRVNSRLTLLAAFGGLLLLIAFAGFDGLQTLSQIESSNDSIREGFLLRTRVLERIRDDLYLSGTYLRDYLLEPESGRAEGHKLSLYEDHSDMDDALRQYQGLLSAEETRPFQQLQDSLAVYWKVMEPALQWSMEERLGKGFPFLRDEVFPRRQSMLTIADQIRDINESQLNLGKRTVAEIFTEFRERLIATILLIIVLGLVLAGFTVRKILALERDTARNYDEIVEARTELKELSARLVKAQEDERRSISRELHDEVGQSMTGVLVEMANLTTLIRSRDLDRLAEKAAEIKKQMENSIGVVRNMALLLRPSMLDDLGLVPALEWQAREVSKRSGIWVSVEAEEVSEELPEEHKTCVYRIVQEALHNCVQHAEARHVKVAVRQEAGHLFLRIEDDGKGFRVDRERGMGLLGMQERVEYLGGELVVDSAPGQGTTLRVTLPLAESPAPAEVHPV